MTIAELEKHIGPAMRGCYLFYGEEDYLKQIYRKKIRKALLPDESLEAFNHERIKDPDAIANALATLPTMAERRLVELEDANFCKMKKEDLEKLAAAAADPGDCVLLVYAREEEFDPGSTKRPSEAYRILEKTVALVGFERQTPAKLASWVGRHFAAQGCFAPPDVCHALLERCGRDMSLLSHEIEKIAAYASAHGEKAITYETVAKVATAYQEEADFAFVNAILARDVKKAFALFGEMKRKREAPVAIAASVLKVVNELASVKILSELGLNSAEIAKELKMSEYPVRLRLNALRELSKPARPASAVNPAGLPQAPQASPAQAQAPSDPLERAVRLCYETDSKLKSRSIDKYFLIERLILDIAMPQS